MAKPRSPVLGYNHNVRYRGLVFHVQTEDSGMSNPHVFTHLFHGGVILTTRKLVYDNLASEETVKGLMQAQHKHVLRDLKKGLFDDKMDLYLGGTPGLLPRGQGTDAAPEPETPSAVMSMPPPLAEPMADPEPPSLAQLAEAAAGPIPQVPFPELPTMPIPSRTQTPPAPASIAIPTPSRTTGRMPSIPPENAASAERLPPPPPGKARGTTPPGFEEPVRTTTEVMIPDEPTSRPVTRRDVSAAFEAIMVAEGEQVASGGGLAEVEGEDGVAEIYSAAPGSAPLPPGVAMPIRPGEYAQHRRRESGRFSPDGEPMTPPPNVPGAPGPLPLPLPQSAPVRSSQPRVPTPPTAPPAIPALVRPSQPRVPTPPPTPPPRATTQAYPTGRTPTPSPQARPGAPRTRSPSVSGVVVTRPAVIIGAPPRTVGTTGPTAAPVPTPTPSAPVPGPTQVAAPPPISASHAAQKPPGGRVRKAREDSDSGMFGQDLISEKSLDEVILAYLSEDGSEE